MKRSGPPGRKARLAPGPNGALRRTGPPTRTGRVRAKSDRKAQEDLVLEEAIPVVRRRSRGLCEARTPVCPGNNHPVQDTPHHVVERSLAPRWAGLHHPDNLLDIHPVCHRWVHDNVTQAYAAGWLRSAPPPSKSAPWS